MHFYLGGSQFRASRGYLACWSKTAYRYVQYRCVKFKVKTTVRKPGTLLYSVVSLSLTAVCLKHNGALPKTQIAKCVHAIYVRTNLCICAPKTPYITKSIKKSYKQIQSRPCARSGYTLSLCDDG